MLGVARLEVVRDYRAKGWIATLIKGGQTVGDGKGSSLTDAIRAGLLAVQRGIEAPTTDEGPRAATARQVNGIMWLAHELAMDDDDLVQMCLDTHGARPEALDRVQATNMFAELQKRVVAMKCDR
jgi:hypothetical protein